MATNEIQTGPTFSHGAHVSGESWRSGRLAENTGHLGQFRSTLDGRLLECNQAFLDIFGFSSRQEALATSALSLYADPASREKIIAQLGEQGSMTNLEVALRRRNGTPLIVLCNVEILKAEFNGRSVIQGSVLNITEQRQAEAALAESEAGLRAIFSENPLPMFVYDDDTLRFLAVNEAALAQYDYARQEFLGLRLADITGQPESNDNGILNERSPSGEGHRKESQHFKRDGRRFDAEVTARPITLGAKRATLAVVQDITARRRAEMERQITHEIIRGVSVTKNLDDLLHLIHRALSRILYAENCYVALYDSSVEMFHFQFHKDKHDETPPPQPLDRGLTAYVFRSGKAMLISQSLFDELIDSGEVELIGTPSAIWIGVPLKTQAATIGVLVLQHYEDESVYTEDDLEFLTSVASQIALAIERKRSEDALRSGEAHLRLLIEQLPAVLCTVDADMKFTSSVGSGLARLGQHPDQVVGMSVQEYFQASDEESPPVASIRRAMAGESATFQMDFSGGIYTCHAEPLRDTDSRPAGAIWMMLDVTERRQLEAQLRQAQKMEAIGRLAGGIAHDFNNLLMVILGYSDMLLDGLQSGDALHESALQIRGAADRAAALTRQLLAFGRKQMLAPTVLNLNSVIGEIRGMLRRVVGEDIEIVINSHAKLWNVRADRNQIEQVILNLALNGRDSMPKGGKLTIETSNVTFDETYATERGIIEKGAYVMLVVSDCGMGIAPEIQGRIFEPFFTTKEPGNGTGLGLATVYGIVQQSGGYIWVYSEPGRGSAFKIYLPKIKAREARRASQDASEPASRNAEPDRREETILLVEDEDGVRELTRNILTKDGFAVIAGASVQEALELSRRHAGRIHLVLTDVVMPGGSGRDLAEKLKETRPETRVLYMSGYADQSVLDQGLIDPAVSLLQKPFTASTLLKKIHGMLDGRPAAAPQTLQSSHP